MGIKQDIEDSLEKFDITKIDGQPTDEDMNQLTRELGAMLATVPTTNGGGDHGHIGMILDDTEYTSFLTGSNPFVVPKNPGPFPTTVSTNEVDRLRQLTEHKQLIIKYKTYQGCLQATRTKIIQAIDPATFQKLLHKNTLSSTATTSNPRNPCKNQCPHCKRHHPCIPIEKCWELPANAASRPAHWKSLADRTATQST